MLSILLCCLVLSSCAGSDVSSAVLSDPSVGEQIVINEVMSSNDIFIPAPDGQCYDWVELRNLTDRSYDLSRCYLTDDERSPRKFQLTGVTLAPYGYTVVYLSGLNGIDVNGNIHAGFKVSSQGETLYLNDSTGVLMSSVKIPESPANISYGYPTDTASFIDADCYWFSAPTPGAENSSVYAADPDELVYETNGVIINEYMTDNSFTLYDADGDYPDWVELYNPTQTDADMSGYMLSDDPDFIGKWRFPDGTVIPAGGYLTVLCSGKNITDAQGAMHTGFSLSSDDTAIVLSSHQGAPVSRIDIKELPENISCGYPAGSTELKLFARPTPGTANTTVAFELAEKPAPDINDGILISETLAASSGSSSYPTDYIEIYNATSGTVNLEGYSLSQRPGEVAFTFPAIQLDAGRYLLVWCDGTSSEDASDLHAPIKLNVGGETLYLSDAAGKIVDHFESGKQIPGVTSGRVADDVSARRFFATPTPGSANSKTWYSSYAPQPSFSQMGGYTESGTQISINVPDGCVVRYTTNGFEPDKTSDVYDPSSPITITRTTVLKAKAYKDGCLASEPVCATYLVEDRHSIAVVSLSGKGLTDYSTGILVDGINENYNQGWVRDVHIEFFDESGNMGVEFNAGAEIFGQTSCTLDKKGLRLNISEQYGASEITYPFFPECLSGINTFKSLLLRPSGQDQLTAMIRDELVPSIIRGYVEVDYMEHRACALYVNGKYWGLYYIRDRFDEDYIVSKYGYTKGNIDLVKGQSRAQAGSVRAYKQMQTFAAENDLTIKENYEYITSLIDLESLCDFWIVETYFANTDSGNIRCYTTEGEKWRWMVYDMDWAFFRTHAYKNFINNHCLDPYGHGAANFKNDIIRKLLENDEFRDLFISRYCWHLNNTFEPERCVAILDQLADSIRDEVPRNAAKWGGPKPARWEGNIDFIREFLQKKPEVAKEHLMSSFNLSEKELNRYLKNNK